MKKYARVVGGVVVEVIQPMLGLKGEFVELKDRFHPSTTLTCVDIPEGAAVVEGDLFKAGVFSKPAPVVVLLVDIKLRLVAEVDDRLAAIQAKWTRFASEYEGREKAAIKFKADNYVGTVPKWIGDYATEYDKTPQQATDTILAQAAGLRTALEALGGLRMRKNRINKAADATIAQAARDQIVFEANELAKNIG